MTQIKKSKSVHKSKLLATEVTSEILKSILNGMDAYLYVTDPITDEILFINDHMRVHFDLPDVVGQTCWKVLQKDMHSRCPFCPMHKLACDQKATVTWEEHNTVTHRYYRNSDKLIPWANGQLVHLQHSVDITEDKLLEQELIATKNAAENASKAKGDFLARMSHEIRTPMNAIIGMTTIAQDSHDIQKKNYCLDKISSASKHLLGIINDILDMSKIEANKFELLPAEFEFKKMLANISSMVNFSINEKNQKLTVEIDDDIPRFIITDEQRLAQVITNLLSNAIKFTPEYGQIRLSVKKIEEYDDDLLLLFDVSDNGIGISKEQQAKLFTSFEQGDGGHNRKYVGTGLGLAISRKIVEYLNGRIWLESDIGKGSTFRFTIQAQKATTFNVRHIRNIEKEMLRILVVDDSIVDCHFFSEILKASNLSCDIALSSHEALEKIAKNQDNPYHIYFIDSVMPIIDGFALTKLIREIDHGDSVIVMVSSLKWKEIAQDAREAGIDSFIGKPITPSVVISCINKCLVTEKEEGKKMVLTPNFAPYTILLVEDIDLNREIVISLLENTKVKIITAENGEKAVNLFKSNPSLFSLIFMDIHMPIMDGYEATKKIRALEIEDAKTIPIIAMTANAFKEDIEMCLAVGMNDHIAKPIDHDLLLRKIRKYLLK